MVASLRQAGHDVRYAAETDARTPDEALAALAAADDRVVLTADYDFGELARRFSTNMLGVILLAPSRQPIEDRIARVLSVVGNSTFVVQGHLTIVEDTRIRSSPLNRGTT
jgi:predicted nuclease of predicted toxin-antitoxin system